MQQHSKKTCLRESVGQTGPICSMDQAKVTHANINDWVLINPKMIIVLMGVVSCFTWLFLAMGTSCFVFQADVSEYLLGAVRLSFILGAALSLFIQWSMADYLARHKKLHYMLSIFFTVLGCLFMGIFNEWIWLSSFIMGCGFSLIYTLYGECICVFFKSSIKTYVFGVFMSAILACGGVLLVDREISYYFAMLFPLIALSAYGLSLVFFQLHSLSVSRRRNPTLETG